MAVVGRKPKPEDQRRNQNKPRHDWIEVIDQRFEDAPRLPSRPHGRWPAWTLRWWRTVSAMPHCSLWDDDDWQFAFDTALIHAAFAGGKINAASELRRREKIMGTTLDARRDLRIRYGEAKAKEERPALVAIESYRKELEG